MSAEDEFLKRLAGGGLIAQDEYDQLAQDLPPELLAAALAKRYQSTNDLPFLVEAARLYLRAGQYYQVLEVCSRVSHGAQFQQMIQKTLPHIRQEYPDTRLLGKLLEEAFLVIDLESGYIVRFPPLMESI